MDWVPKRQASAGTTFPDYDQTATPASPTAGQFWWDRNVHVLKRYDGSSWQWIGLDDLANVDTTGKADTDIVEWDTTTSSWVDVAKPAGGGGGVFKGAKATRLTTQTITHSTAVDFVPDTSEWDEGGYLDLGGANPERVTVPTGQAGKYAVTAGTRIQNSNIHMVWFVSVNGTTVAANRDGDTQSMTTSADVDLAVGDYVTAGWFIVTGANQTADGTAVNFLSVRKLD